MPTLTTNSGYLWKYHFPDSRICLEQRSKYVWEIVLKIGETRMRVGNSSNKTTNLRVLKAWAGSIFWNGRKKKKVNAAKFLLRMAVAVDLMLHKVLLQWTQEFKMTVDQFPKRS